MRAISISATDDNRTAPSARLFGSARSIVTVDSAGGTPSEPLGKLKALSRPKGSESRRRGSLVFFSSGLAVPWRKPMVDAQVFFVVGLNNQRGPAEQGDDQGNAGSGEA